MSAPHVASGNRDRRTPPMKRFAAGLLPGVFITAAGIAAAGITARAAAAATRPAAGDEAIAAVQMLREGGCGGIVPAVRPLSHNVLLDQAAAQWASGRTLAAATESSGYRPEAAS